MQHDIFLAGNHMATGLLREKTTTKSSLTTFFVFTGVDNKERGKALDTEQRRRISWEEKHENWR